MSLVDIKNYLMKVKIASLANLCTCFQANPETIRCMLKHWINKGKVRRCINNKACGSKCFKCPEAATEIYEWIDSYPTKTVNSGLV